MCTPNNMCALVLSLEHACGYSAAAISWSPKWRAFTSGDINPVALGSPSREEDSLKLMAAWAHHTLIYRKHM